MRHVEKGRNNKRHVKKGIRQQETCRERKKQQRRTEKGRNNKRHAEKG